MTRTRVFLAAVLLVFAGAPPALATMSCFHYEVVTETPYEVCRQSCTECDFIGANGEDLGYILSCSDEGCFDKRT
jgi:hypothetical protein